jgi:hypothetical protein
MARVLVAGATGYLGRFVVQELKARGHHVRALARTPEKLDDERRAIAMGDRKSEVRIYHHAMLAGDLSIHLQLEGGEESQPAPSGRTSPERSGSTAWSSTRSGSRMHRMRRDGGNHESGETEEIRR